MEELKRLIVKVLDVTCGLSESWYSRWKLERWFSGPMPCPSCGKKMEKRKGLLKDLQPDMSYMSDSTAGAMMVGTMRMTRVKAWICPYCNNLKTIKLLPNKLY